MNASPHRKLRIYCLAAVAGLLAVIGLAVAVRGQRRVITTTYSHLQGGVVWQRVDYFESYYRPFSMRGLFTEAQRAIATRSWPHWRSRVELRYILLEPVSGAPPEVLESMAHFTSRCFAAGVDGSGRADGRTTDELIEAALAQLEVRRESAPNQSDYRDFRSMKVLHESPQYIVLQVGLEREPTAMAGTGGNWLAGVTSASRSTIYEKQTGRFAPFPENWSPALGPPIAEILDRSGQGTPQPRFPTPE